MAEQTPDQRVIEAVQREHGCRRDVDMQGSAFCSRHHYGCIGGSSTCRRCWPLKGHSEVSFRTPWQEVPDGR